MARYGMGARFKYIKRTAGHFDLPINQASAVALAGDTSLDITLPAAVGDVLEAHFMAVLTTPSNGDTWLDFGTIVSAAVVNKFTGNRTAGYAPFGVTLSVSGMVPYTVVNGDLSAGQVTVRALYGTSGTAGALTVYSNSTYSFYFMLKNIGKAKKN